LGALTLMRSVCSASSARHATWVPAFAGTTWFLCKYLILINFLFVADIAPAHAQAPAYPAKPVRVIVGFAPGGATDIVARQFAQKLSESLGRSFVVENRPGGGSVVASMLVKNAAPDGYTLLAVSGTYAIVPAITKSLPYDALKDFAPISLVNEAPFVVVVHPALPARNIRDLVALAKAQPDKLDYGSAGQGTNVHLAVELFNSLANVKLNHVPYKGTGQVLIDLMAGQVQLTIANILSGLPYSKSGKLRALAVTSERRSKAAPDLPAVNETVRGYSVVSWNGWLARAGTPAEIIAKLNAELVKAAKAPEVVERMALEGGEALGTTPEEFGRYLAAEMQRWQKVVRDANVRLE
jgi:tripartite-type tricarboxylate transporter receptor subunit TctC